MQGTAPNVVVHRPLVIQRAPTLKPLSPTQVIVCELFGIGLAAEEVAAVLGLKVGSVRAHTKAAAAKIASDLSAQARCALWARGATEDVLWGMSLKARIAQRNNGNGRSRFATSPT